MSGTTKQAGIYKITNLVNGKFYIGSAAGKEGIRGRIGTHKSRLKNNKHCNEYLQSAWNKYGEENFKSEVLEIVENKNIIIEREQYYLDLYKPYNRIIGYNLSPTAGSQIGYKHTKKTITKISGRKCNKESKKLMSLSHIGKSSKNKIKIIQLDLNNNQIKIWDSMTDIENILGINHSKVSEVCNGKRPQTGGFKWKYLDKDYSMNNGTQKLIQMDMEGNFIKEWKSAKDASKSLDINYHGIRNVCSGKKETSGAFKWKFITEIKNEQIYQIDKKTNNIIKLWNNLLNAAKNTNTNYQSIKMVCSGKRKSAGGFKWKFVS